MTWSPRLARDGPSGPRIDGLRRRSPNSTLDAYSSDEAWAQSQVAFAGGQARGEGRGEPSPGPPRARDFANPLDARVQRWDVPSDDVRVDMPLRSRDSAARGAAARRQRRGCLRTRSPPSSTDAASNNDASDDAGSVADANGDEGAPPTRNFDVHAALGADRHCREHQPWSPRRHPRLRPARRRFERMQRRQ